MSTRQAALIVLPVILLLYPSNAKAIHRKHLDGRTYSLSMPDQKPDNGYSLLVFLHGQGGDEYQADRIFSTFGPSRGYIVLGPAALKRSWSTSGPDPKFVHKLIKLFQEKFDIPKERTIVVGHSAGGLASYFYVLPYPEHVGAFCSVNGMAPLQLLPQLIRRQKVKVLLINGANDYNKSSVVSGSRYLRNKGYLVHSAVMKNAGHEYVTAKYNPLILQWFENMQKR